MKADLFTVPTSHKSLKSVDI